MSRPLTSGEVMGGTVERAGRARADLAVMLQVPAVWPAIILAIKALKQENERLKKHIRDLDSDLNAACQSEPDGLSERERLGER